LESTAINFPIQGIASDQKYLALAALKPLLTKYGGRFYFELHDGIFCVFSNKVIEKAALEGQQILNNLPYRKVWGFHPPIPLPWDAMIGPNWGDLKEVGQ
jgi:DNA polymerase I-like protein with 3'-5' exonuclease and polymerase domains